MLPEGLRAVAAVRRAFATDVSDASGTLLLDVAGRRWSEEVLEALEIDPAILPAVLESPQRSGETADGVPVAAGAGDQAAGAIGVGVDRPGPVSVALGTSGVVFAALPAFAADPQARVHAFCHAVPGGWHAMGVMLSAAGSLRWLRDATEPGAPYDELVAQAARWPAGVEGLLFLPYLAGERTPHADPDARAAFAGLELRHDRGALVRAVIEGVAFGLRDSLDLVAELGGAPEFGRVSGGGARSALWLEIIASALELPLERVAVDEGAAFGAAHPRRRRRRRVARRRERGRRDGAPGRADRAAGRVGRGLPRRSRALPRALSGAARRLTQRRSRSRCHDERAGRRGAAGRQQPEDVAAEAAADDARPDRAGAMQARDGRLDRGRRDLVVVAQARVRGVEQRPERGEIARARAPRPPRARARSR